MQLIDPCSILQMNSRSQQVVPRAAAEEEALSVNGLPTGEGALVDFDELTDLIRCDGCRGIFIVDRIGMWVCAYLIGEVLI